MADIDTSGDASDTFDQVLGQMTAEADAAVGGVDDVVEDERSPDEVIGEALVADGEEAPAEVDENYTPTVEDLLADLKSQDSDEEVEEDEDDEDEEEERAADKPSSKRMRKLANERRAALQEAEQLRAQQAQLEQQYQQALYQARQEAAYRDQLAQQRMAALDQRFEDLMRLNQPSTEPDLSQMTVTERIKYETQKELEGQFQQQIQALDQKYQQEFGRFQSERQQALEQAALEKRIAGYEATARQGVAPLVEGFEEESARTMSEPLENMVIAWAMAEGIHPQEAAGRLQNYLNDYYGARLNAHAKAKSAKSRKSRTLPSTPQSKAPGTGREKPKVDASGSPDDVFDAVFKGI